MRILWWSNAPWTPTGYGVQTALFTPLLRELGHEVAIGAFYGLEGSPHNWEGIPVWPGGRSDYGLDLLEAHYRRWDADLCITLMDTWKLEPEALCEGMRIAAWTPVDCKPLGVGDRTALQIPGVTPIAVSRFGERMIRDQGLDPLYVPHGVDTDLFRPPADRDQARRDAGIDGRFVVGINAANRDSNRKGFAEQFRAFAAFRKTCPNAVLLVNSVDDNVAYGGLDLVTLARACGISHAVHFTPRDDYLTGLTSPQWLASWYGCLDVLSACSYGEGFGIPILEAAACGTPAVVTDASAMAELAGAGWKVGGQPYWHYAHEAWWMAPNIPDITAAYQQATGRDRRQATREFALAYDARAVLQKYWVPALDRLASMSDRRSAAA